MIAHPSRRATLLGSLGWATTICARAALAQETAPRFRVVIDNDFSGDPDGLFQLAHHLLSPSVTVPLIVGSHLPSGDMLDEDGAQASHAAAKAHELLAMLAVPRTSSVVAGSERALTSRMARPPSVATTAIITEAMNGDARLPLFYAGGAGLTELALAWLAEPRIGKRLKLVWIGGPEYPGEAYPPPGVVGPEYNLGIDLIAAQTVFNDSDIEIWQVPRNVYRQMLYSGAELDELRDTGRLGRYLAQQIDRVTHGPHAPFGNLGETYILGDSPLVTLTALQSSFNADPSSSLYRRAPTPYLTKQGDYQSRPDGRPMRVYTTIDQRLTFADMTAKVRRHDLT